MGKCIPQYLAHECEFLKISKNSDDVKNSWENNGNMLKANRYLKIIKKIVTLSASNSDHFPTPGNL